MSDVTSKIREYCLNLLEKQVQEALNAGPEYLTLLADQAGYDNERTLYLDTMHELSFSRKRVVSKLLKEIQKPFDALVNGSVPEEFRQKGGVIRNVTGAGELEEKLALETMLNKARSKTEIQLQNVARSIDAMMGSDWVKNHLNPLDPEFIIRAWVAGVHESEFNAKGNLAMYGLLDSQLLAKLPAIYERVGQFVEGLAKGDSAPSPKPGADGTSSEGDDFESMFGDIDSVSPEDRGNYSESSGSQQLSEGVIDTGDLIQALGRLQRDRSLDDGDYYASNYLMDLRQLLADQHLTPDDEISPETVGKINDDVIELTRMMFGFIMDDYNFPDDIRYHISRLQIPYLKMGFLDRSMFQVKEHPARQLLMDLSQSINLWDPGHSSGLDQLLNQIIHAVETILDSFDTNIETFVLTQQQFNAFLRGGTHIMTGAPPRIPVGCGAFVSFHPSLGAATAHQLGAPNGLPAYFSIPRMSRSGGPNFLGQKYAPFVVADNPNSSSFRVRDVALPQGLEDGRFQDRRQLRGQVDRLLRINDEAAGDPAVAADEFYSQAHQLITSKEAQAAFDVHSEPDAVRDKYERSSFGQRALLARRLVEAGVPFVTLYDGGWDHHRGLFPALDKRLPSFEATLAALIEDLHERGSLERTLVVVLGEFGRTPKINKDGGRDHWSNAMSVMFAGGGTPPGQVVGATDPNGYAAIERVLSPENFVSTIYTKLGIDPNKILYTPEGRPTHLVSDPTPIKELMS